VTGTSAGTPADVPVPIEIVQVELLVAELIDLSFRGPTCAAERAATPGTVTTFSGPDRRAPYVDTGLVHEWDDVTASMHRWTYSLFARRSERDWVGRRPMVFKRATPIAATKELRRRLRQTSP
jgi:hypothetical protein